MDSRVPATIALHLAKAELKVADLERLEKSTPSLRSNSNQRIVIDRKLKAARDLAQSWLVVVSLVAGEEVRQNREDALDKGFKEAPDRIVARGEYVPGGPDHLYCNRALCYSLARTGSTLVPLTAEDLPDGGICDNCGTDVLA